MIQKIEINGVHVEVGNDLHKYTLKKIGRLDRYISPKVRPSVHAEVKLKEGKTKEAGGRTCEVILHLPHETITTAETTINMYAAIDIVEEKLKSQLKRYKDRHAAPRLHRRLLRSFAADSR